MHIISRRRFITAAAGGAAAMLCAYCAPSSKPSPAKPNVLFIAVDDLNDWVRCLGGHPDVRTPNIDALARKGVLFTNAHCTSAACNPSRASVLTGMYPWSTGVYDNVQQRWSIGQESRTLPGHFGNAGYATVGCGKVFHGPVGTRTFEDRLRWIDDPPPHDPPLNGIPDSGTFDWGPLDVCVDQTTDGRIVDWAVGRLGTRLSEPFFMAVGFMRPHLPWYAPREYFDMYPPDEIALPEVRPDDLEDVPPVGRFFARPAAFHPKVIETANWRKAVAAYLACVTFVDSLIGRVLDALEAGPYARNTTVVLWSDNGLHLGQKYHWHKFDLWEASTHVPLVIAGAGVGKPGGRCTRPVRLVDIYPTLVDICGLPQPEHKPD